jgi:hypothetical protein
MLSLKSFAYYEPVNSHKHTLHFQIIDEKFQFQSQFYLNQ